MAFKTAAELFGDNAGWGTKVPIDLGAPSGGYNSTNRGIGFGEQLTSAIGNRSHWALGLNCDDLNTRLALWETGGLDAAYDLGGAAVPGGGREVLKDSGAITTTSSMGTIYADDPANAHFRADSIADVAGGGGFDFMGGITSGYGFASRVNQGVGGAYTTLAASASGTLNPGGAGADVVRYSAGTVSDGTNTDLSLDGMDFVEVSGPGVNGLYAIFSLGPTPATDIRVRTLAGAAPSFTANVAVTVRLFRAHMMSSVAGRAIPSVGQSSLAVSAGGGFGAALALFSNDLEDQFGTGAPAVKFVHRTRTGENISTASFSSGGRLRSSLTNANFDAVGAQALERLDAGISAININKASSVAGHEIGVLVREQTGDSLSWAGLETRGTLDSVASGTLGIDASINGTFAAPMGRILLPDSDGTPAPPTGQLETIWSLLVQPGVTLVRTLTGTGSGRYYLLKSVNLTTLGSPDEITVCRLDGSALTALELPTAGAMTFQFVQRSTFGGKLPPIPVEGAPAGLTAPTDITPASFLVSPTETLGDPDGSAALAVNGAMVGLRTYDIPSVVLPHTAHSDIAWMLDINGNFTTRGNALADGDVAGATLRTGGSNVACAQTDVVVNHDLRNGLSEADAAGAPFWRFDRTNGWWELITLGGGDSALYFPLLFTGRLMTTQAQVFMSAGSLHSTYVGLQATTPVWGTPGTAPGTVVSNETSTAANGAWGEISVSHSVGLGSVIALSSASYAIRIKGERVGDRVRALRHTIRYTSIGPGGIGG